MPGLRVGAGAVRSTEAGAVAGGAGPRGRGRAAGPLPVRMRPLSRKEKPSFRSNLRRSFLFVRCTARRKVPRGASTPIPSLCDLEMPQATTPLPACLSLAGKCCQAVVVDGPTAPRTLVTGSWAPEGPPTRGLDRSSTTFNSSQTGILNAYFWHQKCWDSQWQGEGVAVGRA